MLLCVGVYLYEIFNWLCVHFVYDEFIVLGVARLASLVCVELQ